MNKPFSKSLFIFRRDLRLTDNTGLIKALEQSEKVIPCFIFDDRQLHNNLFKSEHCLQFMHEALADLQQQLTQHHATLYCFTGTAEQVVHKLITTQKIDAIFFNKDYTPFSIARDTAIATICSQYKIPCISFDDALLQPPDTVVKKDGKPYIMFTPFFKRARIIPVTKPQVNRHTNYVTTSIAGATHPATGTGGRAQGLKLLKKLHTLIHYDKDRDFPARNSSSHVSPHLKFTTISAREAFHAMVEQLGSNHPLIRQLYWRDFFTGILSHFPHALTGPFHTEFSNISWSENLEHFKHWCTGTTGFPLVDAGMRELNQTGIMHNRVRLVTASFLVKDLHINWQWGERYFAQKLTDYDPAVNNGNWQWVASTGCDAQPYFRIFNPWLQQKKFDPDAAYIKQWIPESQQIRPQDLHRWHQEKVRSPYKTIYPAPMVDHSMAAQKIKALYKKIKL